MNILNIWKYISNRRKRQIYFLFLIMNIAAFSELVTLFSLNNFLEFITDKNKIIDNIYINKILFTLNVSSPNQTIIISTILFITCLIFMVLVKITLSFSRYYVTARIGTDLSSKIYVNNLYQEYIFHTITNSSDFIASNTVHVEKTTSAINNMLELISSIIISFTILISLLLINFNIGISSMFVFGSFYILISKLVSNKLVNNSKVITKNTNSQVKLIQESINSIREIIIYRSQEFFIKKHYPIDLKMRGKHANNKFLEETPRSLMEAIGIIIMVLTALILSLRDTEVNTLIPLLGVFALGAQRLLPALQRTYACWSALKSRSKNINEVLKILSLKRGQRVKESIFKSQINNKSKLIFKDSIIIEDVSFKYTKDSEFILNNINLKIEKGDKIAVIGSSGSGKSTLIDIILGILTPTKGRLLFDNTELKLNTIMYDLISHIPQQIYLTDQSFIENIAFGMPLDQIDHERIKYAAKIAKIDKYIESKSLGYNTLVGEGGILLSGGQCQRIAIARAIYRDPQILIIDEGTSALDPVLENDLLNSINNFKEDLTIISISHKQNISDFYKRIVKVENGTILELT